MIGFMHFRDIDERGNINSHAGATVATKVEGPFLYAAVAFCNPKDNYNSHYGRAKAQGRLTQLLGNKELSDDDTYYILPADTAVERISHDMLAIGYRRRGSRA